jgi:hypothetical protein
MGKYGKRNEVKIDPLRYNICLLGEPKIGKTSIVKQMLEKLAGEDGYIFLEMAGEDGADAIEGIVYEDCDTWDDVIDIVEDIEDNKTTDYAELKAIVIDTYDGWIKLAQEEAILIWNKAHPDKQADTIDASWNGFQKGQQKAFDLMFDVITRLKKIGVATIIIGHVKNREMTDIATGTTYQTLTSDVEKVYFNLLKKKMHFLGLAYYDRTIIKEKTGKKNIVTKKEEIVGRITGESRKIKFRDDNMALDSGSRFADIVEEIDFDVDELIKAITDAIKAEANKGSKSIEELESEQKAAEEKRMEKVAEAEKERREKKELDAVNAQIAAYVQEHRTDTDKLKALSAESKKYGFSNPLKITDIEAAKSVLSLIA